METFEDQILLYQKSDISVIIPLYVDHDDRLNNLITFSKNTKITLQLSII